MRYSASEKFEIIELVEQSSLSIRRTLAPIGIPRSTFYDWYSRYLEGGIEALEDGKPRPRRIWNKIPDKIGTAIVNLALEEPDLSPRELAVNFTDTKGSFVSEATVYRLLKDRCPSRKSYPCVAMMQPRQNGRSGNISVSLDRSTQRRILVQR